MTFLETSLQGAFVVRVQRFEDHRGFFARTWCRREFEAQGLVARLAQCDISFNRRKGTLRGMHYQAVPFQEAKLVRCTRGSLYDVIIDLRPRSPTYMKHAGAELSADNRDALYVPEGFAHGFQTLEDDTEVFYQMTEFYAPEYGRGIRWNDPAFGIQWPDSQPTILDRDNSYPDYHPNAMPDESNGPAGEVSL